MMRMQVALVGVFWLRMIMMMMMMSMMIMV